MTDTPKNRGPKPGETPDDRARRDFRIMALLVAGNSEADIARAVGVTRARVNQIVKRELQGSARHQQLLSDKALAIYTTRLETLMKAVWPKVVQQDLKAIEVARRILEQTARLYAIGADHSEGTPPMGDQEVGVDPSSADPRDELAKYRTRHRPAAGEEE